MDTDGPLDFESEDLSFKLLDLTKKRRRKVIDLDDLLSDYYAEKSKLVQRKSKQASVHGCYNSDDDDDRTGKSKEAFLSKFVDDCEKQVNEIVTENEISLWGKQVFGPQKAPPTFTFHGIGNCSLLRSFIDNKLNSVLELTVEKGETFLEGLLLNGWLLKLVFTSAHVEDSVASWIFNLMLYSSNEGLQASACDFWCSVLSSNKEVDIPSVRLDWIPSYAMLMDALKIYGYIWDPTTKISSCSKVILADSGSMGPPQNIRSWVKFIAACGQVRNMWSIFSTPEVEDLLGVVICLFLDRQLQGLSLLLQECLLSLVSFFTDNEWTFSSEKVANSLAHSVPKDLNCLRIVECISGVSARSKHLRREVAFQMLRNNIARKVEDAEGVLRLLAAISMKDKDCDFFRIYIDLVLTDNWLFRNPLLEDRPIVHEMWSLFLRSCSCQITSTDWRSYASKVRNKASYLMQVYGHHPRQL